MTEAEALPTFGTCSLYIDLPLGAAVLPGDWVATEAGSRYVVDTARRVETRKRHSQRNRWTLRVQRLAKDTPIPDDVKVWWIAWYARGKQGRR